MRLESSASRRRWKPDLGFTLVEILVVLLIIGLISALVLPSVIPALSHRQVSEAARILQGAVVGARDSAIHTNAPSGIRLLPDPTFLSRVSNSTSPSFGQIDPNQPLAANRVIPLQTPPDYNEGLASVVTDDSPAFFKVPPYPGPGGGTYPFGGSGASVLMVRETVLDPNTFLPNPPTSWFWNIRLGDKIRFNNSGLWFTVVGPMNVTPAAGNSEMFVNVGPPGPPDPQTYPLRYFYNTPQGFITTYPEFLFLVNSQDDNHNGWIDEGWDGIDNNGDGQIDELAEWENEIWTGPIPSLSMTNQPYTIRRRPIPGPNAQEVALPTQVVVDLTTWKTTRERSRFPVGALNIFTGHVDIMIDPRGEVMPGTMYSSPASFGMAGAFYHFWLAERADVAAPSMTSTAAPLLPLPQVVASQSSDGQAILGNYYLVTIFARTGLLTATENMTFDNPKQPANKSSYNPNLPFLAAQQGVAGGR